MKCKHCEHSALDWEGLGLSGKHANFSRQLRNTIHWEHFKLLLHSVDNFTDAFMFATEILTCGPFNVINWESSMMISVSLHFFFTPFTPFFISHAIAVKFFMQLLYHKMQVKQNIWVLQLSNKLSTQISSWPFTEATISPTQGPEGCCCTLIMLCVALILSNNIIHLSWCIPEQAICPVTLTTL